MGLLQVNTDRYEGKRVSHFEDDDGNKLSYLHMQDAVTIVFDDGDKIYLRSDWRGCDCYISQGDGY